jgi:hypothetical protein
MASKKGEAWVWVSIIIVLLIIMFFIFYLGSGAEKIKSLVRFLYGVG